MIDAEARGAWAELESRLRPYIARRVAPGDVDDLVQEVFMRIHRGLDGLEDGDRFGPWVYRIAANVLTDHHRRQARRRQHACASAAGAAADDGDELLQQGLEMCMAHFIARLPPRYREAISLTELEGVTQSRAAAMVGITLSGMKSRVQRGRAQLRAMFASCCEVSSDGRGRVMSCDAKPPSDIPCDLHPTVAAWAERYRR